MNRGKSLLKNTIILSVGKFLPKLISIITLPIITAVLTKVEFGRYDLISTLVSFLLPIATLQVQSAAFRFLIDCRNDKRKSSEIITNIFVITLPISIILSILIIFIWYSLPIVLRCLVCLYFLADILFLTISQISRGLSHNKEYSISAILLSIINCISIVYCLKYKNLGINSVIFSLFISNAIASLFLIMKVNLFKFINIKYVSKDKIVELIKYSWPMVPNNLSVWLLNLSDRLVITYNLGVEKNAIYAVANKVPNLLAIAQSIFIMAWQENASIAVNDKDVDKYYSSVFNKTFNIMASCTILLISFTPIIFSIIIKGNYGEAYIQMPIIILAMFFNCMSSFAGGIYIAHKKTKNLGITTFVASIVNLFVDIMLVNIIGITAGSISTLIAYLGLYIYRLYDVRKYQKIDYKLKKQILVIAIICFMLYICSINTIYFNCINVSLGLVFVTYLNKSIFKYILKNSKELARYLKEIYVKNPFSVKRLEKSKRENQERYKKLGGAENITILSSNCVAGEIYNLLGLRFNSPTINGLFKRKSDFVKFCINLKEYSNSIPKVIGYEGIHPITSIHPKGLDEIVIRWVHDSDEKLVIDNWIKRSKRINYDKLYIICDFKFLTDEEMIKLSKLKTSNTIIFTNKESKIGKTYFVKKWKGKKNITKYNFKKLNGLYGFQEFFDFVAFLTNNNDNIKEEK